MSLLLVLAIISAICSLYTLHYITKGEQSMELNKEKMLEDMKKALSETENEETTMSFVSEKDESSFFPEEIDGWELVGRASRRVPAHFVNDARYRRPNAGIIMVEETTEE